MAPLFKCFYAGFHKVCGGKVLELFQPNELQAMVIGNTNYDWTELEKVCLKKMFSLAHLINSCFVDKTLQILSPPFLEY